MTTALIMVNTLRLHYVFKVQRFHNSNSVRISRCWMK